MGNILSFILSSIHDIYTTDLTRRIAKFGKSPVVSSETCFSEGFRDF